VQYSVEQNIDFLHLGQWLNSYHHQSFGKYDGADYLQKINIEVQGDFTLRLVAISD